MTDVNTIEAEPDAPEGEESSASRPSLSARGIVAIVVVVALVATTIGLLVWSYNDKQDSVRGTASRGAAVVATVDGTQIQRSTLDAEVDAWVANTDYVKQSAAQGQPIADAQGKALPDFARSRLQTLIADVVVNRIFDERKLTVPADVVQQYQQQVAQDPVLQKFPKPFVDALIQRAARNQAVIDALTPEPTDADIQATYDQQFACPSGRDVAHILVKTLDEANTVVKDLADGADFAKLASTVSTDTGSASQGGSLGCLRDGVYVPEFEAGAKAAEFGKPTAPIKSQFGYHVILVTKAASPSLDSVKDQIVTSLKQNSTAGRQAITQELSKATVTVDPTFGNWVISSQGVPSVVAPGASANQGTTPGAGGSSTGGSGQSFVQDERPSKQK